MTLILSGTDGLSDIDGSASTPAIRGTDANTGIFFPAADTIAFAEGGAEVARFDSSGNFGIGTTSPLQKLQVVGSAAVSGANGGFLMYDRTTSVSSSQWYSPSAGVTRLYDQVAATDRLGVDASGNFQFNSGYGSAATAYGCRAWVNFNGTGTVAIRASGNVSSITDDGTGKYTVNFTTAMSDANYSIVGMTGYRDGTNNNEISWISLRRLSTAPYSTTACAISTGFTTSNAGSDNQIVNVAVFR